MFKNVDEYSIRVYEKGDEVELTSLFNEEYKNYAGFVPKTLEHWRWNCLDRPDVEKEGIIVILHRGKIVAYAVVGRSGNIWELCFDHAHDVEVLVSIILENSINYLAKVGADSATFNLPCEDFAARRACEKLGFLKLPPNHIFLSVRDFERFVPLIFCAKQEKLKRFDEDILIRFEDSPFWIKPSILIEAKNGQTKVETGKKSCGILVETDTSTLTSILLGTTKPTWALLRLKLKVHPLRKMRKVLKLFSLLRISDPWFFPRSDMG